MGSIHLSNGSSRGRTWALTLVAFLFSVPTAYGEGARAIDYKTALALARENAPRIRVADLAVQEADAGVEASSVWKHNPNLAVESGPRFTDPSVLDFSVGIQQKVVFGKRDARQKIARAEHKVAELRKDEASRLVEAETATVFAHALASDAQLKLAQENLALAIEVQRVATIREEVGDAGRLETTLSTLHVSRAKAALSRARIEQIEYAARLRTLMGLADDEPFIVVGSLEAISPSPTQVVRSDVQIATAQFSVAEARERLAKRHRIPEFGIGVVAGIEEETTVVKGVIEMTLPFFYRGQDNRLRASAEKAMHAQHAELLAARATRQATVAREKVEVLEKAVVGFRDGGLEAAKETAKIATESYKSGAIPISDLLIIQRELVATQNELIELLLLAAEARIELHYVGVPFDQSTPMPKAKP